MVFFDYFSTFENTLKDSLSRQAAYMWELLRKFIAGLLFATFLVQNSCSWGSALPEARITIKVLDEEGKPVEGARVGIGFERNTGGGTEEIAVVGVSDANGLFSGAAKAMGYVGFNISKDGYYKSTGNYNFKEKTSAKWEPWNPEVHVVLRKIKNPVPMYAREIKLELPVLDKEIGFDLIASDWVAPSGKGVKPDFIIKIIKTFRSREDYDSSLIITFPNKYDGIIKLREDYQYGSRFKLPRNAPENEYQTKLFKHKRSLPGKIVETDYDKNNGYIFRIRSEIKNEELYRAMYGKIQGDISYDPINTKTALIVFRYFLNPDYTQNLEFDPARNLFTNLKDTERVGLE